MSVCRVLVLAIHLGRLTLALGENSTTDATQVSIALLSVTRLLSNRLSFCLGHFIGFLSVIGSPLHTSGVTSSHSMLC